MWQLLYLWTVQTLSCHDNKPIVRALQQVRLLRLLGDFNASVSHVCDNIPPLWVVILHSGTHLMIDNHETCAGEINSVSMIFFVILKLWMPGLRSNSDPRAGLSYLGAWPLMQPYSPGLFDSNNTFNDLTRNSEASSTGNFWKENWMDAGIC